MTIITVIDRKLSKTELNGFRKRFPGSIDILPRHRMRVYHPRILDCLMYEGAIDRSDQYLKLTNSKLVIEIERSISSKRTRKRKKRKIEKLLLEYHERLVRGTSC